MKGLEKFCLTEIIDYVNEKSKFDEKFKQMLNIGAAYLMYADPTLAGTLSVGFTMTGMDISSLLQSGKKLIIKKSKEEEAFGEYERCLVADILLLRLAIKEVMEVQLSSKDNFIGSWKLKDLTKEELEKINKEENRLSIQEINSDIESYIGNVLENVSEILETDKENKVKDFWKDKIVEKYRALKNKLCLDSKIYNIFSHGYYTQPKNEYGELYQTLSEFEKEIKLNTKPSISLNFFNYDDKEFCENVLLKVEDSVIYVKSRSREEALLYIMYIIKNEKPERIKDTYIIRTFENWEKLRGKSSGKILIPYFDVDKIEVISENTCIFSYGKGEYLDKRSITIELKERLLSDMAEALSNEMGEYTNGIIRRTNGIFASFKRLVFQGKFGKPLWDKGDNKILLPALFAGEWTDSEGDKEVISILSGKSYDEYLDELKVYTEVEDPFFKNNPIEKQFKIANLDEAWNVLIDELSEEQWQNFRNLSLEVLKEVPQFYSLPVGEHYMQGLANNPLKYSEKLKEGISISLIMLKNSNKFDVDSLIKELFKEINTREKWFAISSHLSNLIEASPKVILSVFQDQLNNEKSNFWELFTDTSDSSFGGRSYYTSVLWSLEKMLFIEEYVVRSIKILVKIAEKNFTYNIMNSPLNTLNHALSAWLHDINATVETKVNLARYIIKKSSIADKVIESILPEKVSRQHFTGFESPNYIIYKKSENNLSRKNVFETYKEYTKLAIEDAGDDLKKWGRIISKATFFDFNLEEEVFSGIQNAINNNHNDQEKYEFLNRVGKFIHKNLYYIDAVWALKKKLIDRIEEDIYNKIIFKNNLYKYVYYFTSEGIEFSEIEVFGNDVNQISEEKKKAYITRKKKLMEIIKKDKIDYSIFEEFLRILNFNIKGGYYNSKKDIGKIVAEEIHQYNVDMFFIKEMIRLQENDILISYTLSSYYEENQDLEVINKVVEEIEDVSLKVLLLERLDVSLNVIKMLESYDEEVRSTYWKTPLGLYLNHEIDLFNKVWEKLLKYNNFNCALSLLCGIEEKTPLKNIEILEKMKAYYNETKHFDISSGFIRNIFKRIYEIDSYSLKEKERIFYLEWFFFNVLVAIDSSLEPKYIKKEIDKNPGLLTDLIKSAYKQEGVETTELTKDGEKIAKNSYDIISNLKFAPCSAEKDYSLMKDWVEIYLDLIEKNNQKSIGMYILGRLLSYSPIGDNGIFPTEFISKIFEEFRDENLEKGFVLGVINKRGVYSGSNGKSEKTLSDRYGNYAKKLEIEYPNISNALKKISENYLDQSQREKESALYEL